MNHPLPLISTIGDLILEPDQFPWSLECQQPPELPAQSLPFLHPHHQPSASSNSGLNSVPIIPYQQPYMAIPDMALDLSSFEESPAISTIQTPSLPRPVKTRKKPGPKPNPATPYLRKEKNRVAQRAFRARKEEHIRGLERTIENIRKQSKAKDKEIAKFRREAIAQKAQVSYLKGIVLSLHLLCVKYKLAVPLHLPYMSNSDLDELVSDIPHVSEVYRKARNMHEKEMKEYLGMFDEAQQQYQSQSEKRRQQSSTPPSSPPSGTTPMFQGSEDEDLFCRLSETLGSPQVAATDIPSKEETVIHEEIEPTDELYISSSPSSSTDPTVLKRNGAIHSLQQQLRLQSKLLNLSSYNTGLQPTILQRIIPHDPRIDLLPGAAMRDRLIIFQDLVDNDRFFSTLVNGSTFHGTDPIDPDHWILPFKFAVDYWFLCYKVTNYQLAKVVPSISASDILFRSGNDFLEFINSDLLWKNTVLNEPEWPRANQEKMQFLLRMYAAFRAPPSLRSPIAPTLSSLMEALDISRVLEL